MNSRDTSNSCFDDEQHAAVARDRSGPRHHDVREAASRAEGQRLAGQRVAKTLGADALGVAAQREQGDDITDGPGELEALASMQSPGDDVAVHGTQSASAVRVAGKEQRVRELVIEALSAEDAEQHDVVGLRLQRVGDGELEVGLVLLGENDSTVTPLALNSAARSSPSESRSPTMA